MPTDTYGAAVYADTPTWWGRLNEATGTSAADQAGGSAGTTTGSPTLGVAPLTNTGRAIYFDGTDDGVSFPDSSAQRPSTLVLEAWITPDSPPNYGPVIVKSNSAWTNGYGLANVSGSLRFWINHYSTQNSSSNHVSVTMPSGTAHVVCTYDLTHLRVYIDGTEVPSSAVSLTAAISHDTGALRVGYDGAGDFWKGVIDEPAVYASLSTTRITAHHTAGVTPRPARPAFLNPDSQWRRPLDGSEFTDGQSTDIGKWVGDRLSYERNVQGNGPWVATSNSSGYVWIADEDTPLRKVVIRTDIGSSLKVPLQEVFDEVPIEDWWYTTYNPGFGGEDSVLNVYQPSTDTLWEIFWFRRKNGPGASGTLPGGDTDWLQSPFFVGADSSAYGSCHWGGATKNASKSFGVYDNSSWPPLSKPNWGASAGSHIFMAGMITQEELDNGVIEHALACDFGMMRAGVVSHPAFRTDGLNADPYSIPYGTHMYLPSNIDLDALTFATDFGKMIAVAMQNYGIIARNQTGSGFSFFCEDPRPSGNAEAFWLSNGSPNPTGWFEGFSPPAALDGIPWDSLVVIEQYKHKTYPTFQVEGEPTVYQRTAMLNALAGRSPAVTRYLALFSISPGRGGGGTEIAITRKAVASTDWSTPADTGTNVEIHNVNSLSFAAASGAKAAPVAVGLFDASTGGNLLAYGWLPPTKRNAIANSQVVTLAPEDVWFQDLGVSFYANSNT
jgi:hypothetical protein